MALFGSNGPVDVSVRPARDVITAEVRPALLILMAAVGLLLSGLDGQSRRSAAVTRGAAQA